MKISETFMFKKKYYISNIWFETKSLAANINIQQFLSIINDLSKHVGITHEIVPISCLPVNKNDFLTSWNYNGIVFIYILVLYQ